MSKAALRPPAFRLHWAIAVGLSCVLTAQVGCDRSPASPSPAPAQKTAKKAALPAAAPKKIALPSGSGAMAPRLAALGERVALSWLEPAAKGHRLYVALSKGDGWGTPAIVVESAEIFVNWADVPTVTLHPDGTMLAHWAQKSGAGTYAYDVRLATSKDGQTWTTLGAAHDDGTETEHGFVSSVVEGGGIRLFWLDGRAMANKPPGPMSLRTAVVEGGKVGPVEVVDPQVCDCCGTSAAVGQKGPVVVYRDRSEAEIRDISIARRSAEGWSAPSVVAQDRWQIRGCPVNGPVVVATGERLCALWYSAAGGRARVQAAFSDDGGASFRAPIDIDSDGGDNAPLGRVAAMALDGGEVLAIWLDREGEAAAIRAARVSPDGKRGEAMDIARTSRARSSGFPTVVRRGEAALFVWTVADEPTVLEASEVPLSLFPAPTGAPRPVETSPRAQGWQRPSFEAKAIDGTPATMASLAGKPALINLWATWCKPCREELPALSALHDRYSARGLQVVGVSVDAAESASDLDALVKAEKLSYAIWHDPDNQSQRLFEVTALPASFLFDASGPLVWSSQGPVTVNDTALVAAIEASLPTPP